MTFDPNDPRLTAYVLGELEPAEQAEVEAMIHDSPECRQAVDEIRSTIAWLTDQLHEEQASHSVSPGTNHQPVAAVLPLAVSPARPWWRRPRSRLGALAALLLLATTTSLIAIKISPVDEPKHHRANAVAKLESPNIMLRSSRPAPAARKGLNDGKSPILNYGYSPTGPGSAPVTRRERVTSRGGGVADRLRAGALAESEQLALASDPSRSGLSKQRSNGAGQQRDMAGVMGGMGAMGGVGQAGQGQGRGQQGIGQGQAQNPDQYRMLSAQSAQEQSGANQAQGQNGAQQQGANQAQGQNGVQQQGANQYPGQQAQSGVQLGRKPSQAQQGQEQRGQGQGQQFLSGAKPGMNPSQGQQGQSTPGTTRFFAAKQPGQNAPATPAALMQGNQAPGQVGQNSMPSLGNSAPDGNAAYYRETAPNVESSAPAMPPTDASQAPGALAKVPPGAAGELSLAMDGARVQNAPAPLGEAPAGQNTFLQAAPAAPVAGASQVPAEIPVPEPVAPPAAAKPIPEALAEVYAPIVDNPFLSVEKEPQSTFSIDVDTASYSNVRRFLTQNMLPPPDAVRIEEFLNYFPYRDAPPPNSSEHPFAVHVEIAHCPWNAGHRLARIGIAARPIDQSRRSASNLVFLVDVSGSMDQPDKLPLVQWGLQRLVDQLGENDRVAIVVYASASGLVLPSTSCIQKAEILSVIEQLRAGGSTNGGAGIQLAYDVATKNFIKNGTNRVILATDGDLNVGVTGDDELVRLIEAKARSGVFLSVLGVGTGNLKDGKLEKLADKGNGHYAYIDSPREAYKVLVEEMGANLITVAKDVKIQVDFNAARVSEYRLIGYEDRALPNEAFLDDTKDAGEIGAGHHVTALYELVPAVKAGDQRKIAAGRIESFTVKLRYKKPDEDKGRQVDQPAIDSGSDFAHASDDLKFASAVAGFGMMLRGSPFKGTLTYAGVLELVQPTLARDPGGYRKEFVELVRKAQSLPAAPGAGVQTPPTAQP